MTFVESHANEPAVQVYLRLRPLIPEEKGHDVISYDRSRKHKNQLAKFRVKLPAEEPAQVNPVFASAPPLRRRQDAWKTYEGFGEILEKDCNNERAYQTTVRPLVSRLLADPSPHQSACVFTYGHTGSGKSHTLLGYNDELGVYKFAAAELLQQLQAQDPSKCLMVRVTELYKDQVLDLLTYQPCSIRQDSKGTCHIRGPMREDEQGRIQQLPLGKLCHTPQQVIETVEGACAARRVGTSTHHSQSSRSHLILELEVVTSELVDQRRLLLVQDAQLTRLKWLQTERMSKGKDRPLPQWTNDYHKNPLKLRTEIRDYEGLVKASRKSLAKLSRNLGGTLVFCDLAGNEYARDAAGSTAAELEEAAQINQSLLAVKEMIRSLNNIHNKRQSLSPTHQKRHLPSRGSKLTQILARHLQTRAVMLAHISPSQESLKKTINTLNYSSMVCSSPNKQQSPEVSPMMVSPKHNSTRLFPNDDDDDTLTIVSYSGKKQNHPSPVSQLCSPRHKKKSQGDKTKSAPSFQDDDYLTIDEDDNDITIVHSVAGKKEQGIPTDIITSVGKNKNCQNLSMMMTTTERLKGCLKDNSMTDVALVGDDGTPIPAIRCVLGSASPVLKKLLYAPSADSFHLAGDARSLSSRSGSLTTLTEDRFVLEPQKSPLVHLPGFRGKTIQALVEYCCSDGDLRQISFFKPDNQKGSSLVAPAKAVIEMLDFAQLAIHYEIPKVAQQVVYDFVIPLTKRHPQLACLIFNYLLTVEFPQQCSDTGSLSYSGSCPKQTASEEAKEAEKVVSAAAILSKLHLTSLTIIRTQPYLALVPVENGSLSGCSEEFTCGESTSVEPVGGVVALHAKTLAKVMQDHEVEADELFLFLQLQRWHQYHALLKQKREDKSAGQDRQHTVTDHVQKMVKGSRSIDEDSFQFEASFSEFMIANADSEIASVSSKLDNRRRNKGPPSSPEFLSYTCPEPTAVCKELVQYLDLAAIDPIQLKEIVSTAEFVDQEQLMNALWEQAKTASQLGGLSFGSIVRGSGVPSTSLPGAPTDLTEKQGQNPSTIGAAPEHQYTKSHILVEGAGVDCNGIYAQVMPSFNNNCREGAHLVKDELPECETIYSAITSRKDLQNLPTLMSSSTESTDISQTTSTSSFGPAPKSSSIPTGVCLRFVKQSKRRQNKGKTYFLVCRRELAHTDALERGNAAPFIHQWSIIEQDNRTNHLRVLYEWEPDEDATYNTSGLSGRQNIPTATVFDSSTLQQFPESGWTSVRERYFPAPTCKWQRPRHGLPVLVVPPATSGKACKEKPLEGRPETTMAKLTRPPPPPPRPGAPSAKGKQSDNALLNNLMGLSPVSSVSYSETDPNRRVMITIVDKSKIQAQNKPHRSTLSKDESQSNSLEYTITSTSATTASYTAESSTFKLSTARRRVSLADVSLANSDTKSMCGDSLVTYEI